MAKKPKGPRPPGDGPDYRELIKSLQSHLSQDGFHTILTSAFAQQREVIEDTCRWKAALCTRRAGKSYAAGIYLYLTALANPGVNCLYITLNHQMAKSIMFKDIMLRLAREHHIEEHQRINWNELTITLKNGSQIRFMGLDANPNISNSIYGGKYKLAVIDECASFRYDLEDLIYRKLRPALADQRGIVLLIGTPDNVNDRNFFYQVTREDPENRPEEMKARLGAWHVYRWSGIDNPYMKEQFLEDIEELRRINPAIEEDPAFQQMYLGRWTTALSAQVYAYDLAQRLGKTVHYGTEGNDARADLPPGEYRYLAGVDFGFDDASTIVIGAYNKHEPILYVVDCFKQCELEATPFAEIILSYKQKYGLKAIYADFSDKQMVRDLNHRMGLGMQPVERHDKRAAISLINGAFLKGEIRLHTNQPTPSNVPGPRRNRFSSDSLTREPPPAFTGTAPLIKELVELPWDQKKLLLYNTWEEHPAFDNHLTDALLYMFREAKYFKPRPRVPEQSQPVKGSSEYYVQLLQRMTKEEERRKRLPWYQRKLT